MAGKAGATLALSFRCVGMMPCVATNGIRPYGLVLKTAVYTAIRKGRSPFLVLCGGIYRKKRLRPRPDRSGGEEPGLRPGSAVPAVYTAIRFDPHTARWKRTDKDPTAVGCNAAFFEDLSPINS